MSNCGCNTITIPTGANGWSPVLAVHVVNDTTEVLELVDWIGGTGSSPAIPTNPYIGSTGFVAVGSAINIKGTNGTDGTDGIIILDSYNDLTGIGNDATIGENTLRTYTLLANELSTNGDYLDIDIFFSYAKQALLRANTVTMRYKFGGSTIFTDTELSALDLGISVNIQISRISSTSQMWVFSKKTSDVTFVFASLLIDITNSSANLTVNNDFLITADNGLAVANQIILKKCVIKKISI